MGCVPFILSCFLVYFCCYILGFGYFTYCFTIKDQFFRFQGECLQEITASHLHPLPWQRPQKQLVGGGIKLIHTFAIIMSFFIMASCGGKYFYSSLQWEHSLAVIIGARHKHASRLCANWHMKPTMP